MNDFQQFLAELEAMGDRARTLHPVIAVGIMTILASYHAGKDTEFAMLCDGWCQTLEEKLDTRDSIIRAFNKLKVTPS